MKNKNIIWMIVAIIGVIALIGIVVALNNGNSKKDEVKLNFKQVANIKQVDNHVPDFSIDITGSYVGTLDRTLLESTNVPIYEFDAGIDNGWEVVTNHYVGVKLSDVIDAMIQGAPYTMLKIISSKYRSKIYDEDMIGDNIYLVFSRDGKPIRKDNSVTMLVTDNNYSYSVEDVSTLQFISEGTEVVIPEDAVISGGVVDDGGQTVVSESDNN